MGSPIRRYSSVSRQVVENDRLGNISEDFWGMYSGGGKREEREEGMRMGWGLTET